MIRSRRASLLTRWVWSVDEMMIRYALTPRSVAGGPQRTTAERSPFATRTFFAGDRPVPSTFVIVHQVLLRPAAQRKLSADTVTVLLLPTRPTDRTRPPHEPLPSRPSTFNVFSVPICGQALSIFDALTEVDQLWPQFAPPVTTPS